jgi:hypothetical protein
MPAELVGMGATYGKGDRGKATKLHSEYVRARAGSVCQRCGRGRGDIAPSGKPVKQIHCAHVISRNVAATRTDENNAFCLCASCHWYFGKWPVEFALFVFDCIGRDGYNKLFAKAEAGKGLRVDWSSEVQRLQGKLSELDVARGMPG